MMRTKHQVSSLLFVLWLSGGTSLFAASAIAQATPAQQMVPDAAAAIGGRARVLAVATLITEGHASNPDIGQAMAPEEAAACD